MNKQTIPTLALSTLLSTSPALSNPSDLLGASLEELSENTFQVLVEDRTHAYNSPLLQEWKIAEAYTLSRGLITNNNQQIPGYQLQRPPLGETCYFSDDSIKRPISGLTLETTDTIGTLYGSIDCADFLESLNGESITFTYKNK